MKFFPLVLLGLIAMACVYVLQGFCGWDRASAWAFMAFAMALEIRIAQAK